MSEVTETQIQEESSTNNESNRLQKLAVETTRQSQTLNGATEAATPSGLSEEETKELRECEVIVSLGWKTILDVGRALATIRSKRLYRGTHPTFEEYCREKFRVQ